MKILIVEDDVDSRILLERMLLSQGYAVDSAANGVKALEMANLSPPDLIVSDIMMPEMDGFELCRKVKTDERLRTIPFVFYTATFIEPKDEKLAMSLGASHFLLKPMAPEDLFRAIKEIINEHRLNRLHVPGHPLATAEELTAMQLETLARKLDKKVRELEKERENLRQTETFLKTLIRTIPDLVWFKNPDGVYMACNRRMELFFGAQEAEIIGKTDYDFIDQRQADLFRQKDLEAVSAGKPSINEEEFVFADDGHRELLETIKTPMFDDQGRLIGVLGIGHDITARRQAQEKLRESEERFRQAIEFSPVPMAIADTNGRILYRNREFPHRFGYTMEDTPSIKEWARLALPDPAYRESCQAQWDEDVAQALSSGGATPTREYTITCKDGTQRQVEFVTRPLANMSVTVVNDVTEHRALENQLRQAQKMEAIGQLAGGIAHDFNNILTGIIGFTDLSLRQTTNNPALHSDLSQVRKAADRATDLVRHILTFSRRQQQEKFPLQAFLIIKEAIKLLRASIPSTIEIRQDIASQAAILADPTLIHQMVMNLCTNAYHAMKDKGGTMAVSLHETEIDQPISDCGTELPPGRYLKLSVSDTGCGMSKDTLPRIFEPYFTTKEKGVGTGLGLAVVHGIVKEHQGRISVYSEPGNGTSFNVYLPMILEAPPESEPAPLPPSARANERIMVVDDEASICDTINRFLTHAGYRVDLFADGEEAWAALKKNPASWDLLLTDQTMPIMTGDLLAAKARELVPDMPVIICSGFSERLNEKSAKALGVKAFLQKPVASSTLLTEIAKALGFGVP
jgi:two-component system, cell cycle sensor histidine kinase and response regulator CckA